MQQPGSQFKLYIMGKNDKSLSLSQPPLFIPSPNPSLPHPRLLVLEACLCRVPLCRSWLFMMASCLCFRSIILALISSSTHRSGVHTHTQTFQ